MKQLFILCAVAMAFTLASCNDKKNNGKLDPNAMISLRPAAGVKAEANPEHLTALQIVEQASIISFWHATTNPTNAYERGFNEDQKDFANVRLLMFGNDVIGQYGDLIPYFIEAEDVLIVIFNNDNHPIDTIAYVPNKVLRTAETQIKAAYANGNYAACYTLFDKAFTFTPITGAEWLELKSKNLQ